MTDAAEKAKSFGGKALRVLGTGLKEVGRTVIAGFSDRPSQGQSQGREFVEEPVYQERQEKVQPKFIRSRASDMSRLSQPTRRPGMSSKKIVPNPFPHHVSEQLGIPHRDFLSQREVELIQKDLRRIA